MKKIILDAYTDRAEIYRFSQIRPSSEFLPQWFKSLPSTPELNITDKVLGFKKNMRGCAGFTDLYGTGFMLALWSDLLVEMGGKGDPWGRWQFSDEASAAAFHPDAQRNSFMPDSDYQHLKINSPWVLSSSSAIDWLVAPPVWNIANPSELVVPTGILNFKYQNHLNANILLKRAEERRVIHLKFGQPLLHLIPLTERPVEIRHHLVRHEEWVARLNYSGYGAKFIRSYNLLKKLIRKETTKCPFGGSHD